MATLRDDTPPVPKLNSLERSALHILEKHGELLLGESGVFFCTIGHAIPRARIQRLANLGLCRIDLVGGSCFAVFVRKP